MSDDEKTTEPDNRAILNAIRSLEENFNKRFDKLESKVDEIDERLTSLEKFTNAQFEAIRQGISANSAAFDRLEAKFHENRVDILNVRADMKDMTEFMRRWKNESTKEIMELK